MKGLHDAAVDQNSGWIGRCAVGRRYQRIDTVVNQPQSNRPARHELEGRRLERRNRPQREAGSAQLLKLSCGPRAELTIAHKQFPRKCQYPGPDRFRNFQRAGA
jgi:hypothetical protein